MNITVESISKVALSKCIIGFLGHILYMREQIPAPLTSILPALDATKSQQQYIEKIQRLENTINEISKNNHIHEAIILLGPTMSAPREVYKIQFNCSQDDTNTNAADFLLKQIIRHMIQHWSELELASIPLTNTYIILYVDDECSPIPENFQTLPEYHSAHDTQRRIGRPIPTASINIHSKHYATVHNHGKYILGLHGAKGYR